jgi:uncharacterized delta-60 repeat protein
LLRHCIRRNDGFHFVRLGAAISAPGSCLFFERCVLAAVNFLIIVLLMGKIAMKNSLLKNMISYVFALLTWAITAMVVNAQSNGSVDTSFGTLNNWAVFDPVGQAHFDVTGNVTDLLPLPDGKVLAAGSCTTVFGTGACLFRWNASGEPDSTFGAGGVAFVTTTPVLGNGRARLLRRPNGAIFIATACNLNGTPFLCVSSVNANGSGFDTSFGGTGGTAVPLPAGYSSVELESIALQPDGKLLVGATCWVGANYTGNSSVCVTRLTSGAIFDTAFGTNNWSLTTPGPDDRMRKLIVLRDGQYLAVANCAETTTSTSFLCPGRFSNSGQFFITYPTDIANRFDSLFDARVQGEKLSLQWRSNDGFSNSNYRLSAARRDVFTASGTYDDSFGGYPSTGIAGNVNLDSSNDGYPTGGTILKDGSFFYFGQCNNLTFFFCSARLTQNGVLDTSYGTGGRYEYSTLLSPWNLTGGAFFHNATKEAPNGKVLVAGACNDGAANRPCVLKLNGGPDTARTCTMDIDGDGAINATTDGLILLRAMLGFSGSAALSGTVAQGAVRSTWPQVRDYLFDQCQMPVPVQ